ncbi:MAG: hypothetical protein CMK74_22000 [Pseudomonadales bacterium]|nr:hypothetical protein [Pseudomonadales bacterium]|tara:strand:- start:26 stop:421 length:396 start_codon:yes stop_codon:yes gene_type:complete
MQYLFAGLIYSLIGAVVWATIQYDLSLGEHGFRFLAGSGLGMAMVLGYWWLTCPTYEARPVGFTPFGAWPFFAVFVVSGAMLLTPAESIYASEGYYWWSQHWVRFVAALVVLIGGYAANIWIDRSPRLIVI